MGPKVPVKERILFPKKYKIRENEKIKYCMPTISPNAFLTPSTAIQS
jgi:hypothetical protein